MLADAVSLSGIHSGVFRLGTAAHRIANALTPGFRSSRADQVTLRGGGTTIAGRTLRFSSGPLSPAAGFSLAIQGEGFFQIRTPQGPQLARSGQFHVDGAGDIVTSGGGLLEGAGPVPPGASSILVTGDGRVLAVLPDGSVDQIGSIPLFDVANPGGLLEEEGTLFSAGPASGPPLPGAAGSILFGALEGSNSDLAAELADAAFARASIESNIAVLRTQDEALGDLLDVLA